MKKRFYIVIFLLLAGRIALPGQAEELSFFPLNREDGLSDDNITDIVKDKSGYLWIGTANGLNRFDGHDFTVFQKSLQPGSIPDNRIKDLLVTRNDHLWVGFEYAGAAKFNPVYQMFSLYSLDDLPERKEGSRFVGFSEDVDSNLYLATTWGVFIMEQGDSLFRNISDRILPIEAGTSENTEELELFSITASEKEGVWIAFSGNRLVHYEHRTGKSMHYQMNIADPGTRTIINTMICHLGKVWIGGLGPEFYCFDPETESTKVLLNDVNLIGVNQISLASDSSMWLSSSGGLVHYSPLNERYTLFTSYEKEVWNLSNSSVKSFYEDEAGIYWVGLNNSGINYAFKELAFKKVHQGTGHMHLSAGEVTSLMHDKKGNLWVGLTSGIVERHDYDSKNYKVYSISALTDRPVAGTIFSLIQDKSGNIYCTSWRGGIQKYNPLTDRFEPLFGSRSAYFKHIDGIDIRDALADEQGNLWLAMHGIGVYHLNLKDNSVRKILQGSDSTGLSSEWVYQLEMDDEGFLWVTSAWGLSKINSRDYTVTHYLNFDETGGLTDNAHNTVTKDKQGNIWIGTEMGLNLYHRDTDAFFGYTISDGLSSDIVRGLIQDNSGLYWMSTPYGIVSFKLTYTNAARPVIESVNTYTIHDGLLQDNFAANCISEDATGLLYFGGISGIDYFQPEQIQPFFMKPELRISGLKIFGETVIPGSVNGPAINENQEIVLSHKENMVSVDFVALNYFKSESNRYSYRLTPVTEEFVDLGKDRSLVFSGLSPGHYSLSLLVETENGFIAESSDILKFYIVPPLWKRIWFMLLLGAIVIAIGVSTVLLYTANLRKKQDVLEKLVKQRTQDLQASNEELKEKASILNNANLLLSESKHQIEQQAEELLIQSEKLEERNEELKVINSMKDKFFSIIAHDLKNPFNIISGFTQLLTQNFDSYSDEKRKELLQNIRESTSVAYSLLENLLHWSNSQTGRLVVNAVSLNVSDLFENQESLFRPTMLQKDLNLQFSAENELVVKADTNLLNTVLRNLISNAYKFSMPGGTIQVVAKAIKGSGMIEFEVRDTGVGISEKEVAGLFIMGKSVSRSGTQGESGTGLGMMLCKEFVEKMNGDLRIVSEVGRGTSVFFRLPLA